MRRARNAGLVVAVAGTLTLGLGCSKPAPPSHTGPPVFVLRPGGDFYDAPFPSDARRVPSGAPDFRGLPGLDEADFLEDAARLVMRDESGASPFGVVSLPFTAPPTLATPPPRATMTDAATVSFVDVDPHSLHRGERRPALVHVVSGADDVTRPRGLVQLLPLPGVGLRPHTTYAAVVLRSATTPALDVPAALQKLLNPDPPDDGALVGWHASFAPLRESLPALGLAPADVAAATVFTTSDPTLRVRRMIDAAAKAPAPELVSLEKRAETDDFVALRGVVRLPMYQRGDPPFLFGGGDIVTDADGAPQVVRLVDAPFELSLPKTKMPAAGFPLYLYLHGTGGRASQANDRGRVAAADLVPRPLSGVVAHLAAREGFATACVAGPFSPDRIGWRALDGYGAYAFFRPAAMRDNFVQMLLEQVHFANLLKELAIQRDRLPGVDLSASHDGRARFDASRAVVGGQSLGSYLAGMLAQALPRFDGAVLSGAGGGWIEFAFGPKDPVDLQALLELAALDGDDELDRFHPLLSVFQAAVDPVDNTHYTRRMFDDVARAARVPHVLVVEGYPDAQIPTALQAPLVRSLGARLALKDGAPPDDLLPLLGSDRAPVVTSNVTLKDGTVRTVAVTRWPRDEALDGHHVFFQLDGPAERARELLAAVREGRAPVIHAP